MIDLMTVCRSFYSAHYIPLICFRERVTAFSFGLPERALLEEAYRSVLGSIAVFPTVFHHRDGGYYGVVKVSSEASYLVIGPVFSVSVSQDVVRTYMRENIISHTLADDIYSFLSRIPQLTFNHFANILSFANYIVNGEQVNLLANIPAKLPHGVAETHQEAMFLNREMQKKHGTWLFEMQMLDYIRNGNPEGLKHFLLRTASERELTEGIIGETPIRHAKNIFMGLVAFAAKSAAIPGGMDVEEAYQLMDSYCLECERQYSVETVHTLQFQMLIDFAARVGLRKVPSDLSAEVYACIQYIHAHINEPVSIESISNYIRRGRSFVIKHFKEETGHTIADYIASARIHEAKSLLRYTDKTISEISEYLCFSNQSHFQRVFKLKTGSTPTEFRKAKRILS